MSYDEEPQGVVVPESVKAEAKRLSAARAAGKTSQQPAWNHKMRRAFARYLAREQARVERRIARKLGRTR